jgi:hypothetical protein
MYLVLSVAVLMLAGCDSTPANQAKTEKSAPPEKKEVALYTAQQCLPRMTDQALRWSRDARPFHVESAINKEANGHDGKATVWRASFVSMSLQKLRTFTCSGSRLADEAPYGVSASAEMTMTSNAAAGMFDRASLQVDSDAAFKTAQEHGGSAILKKNASQEVMYALALDPKGKQLVWYVMYGQPPDTKGIGVVDATSGKFMHSR